MYAPIVTVTNSDNYNFDFASSKNKKTEKLNETRQGISLPTPFGEILYSNSNKNDLVLYLPKLYKSEINKPKYILEDGICYGVIKLNYPDKRQVNNIDNDLVSKEDCKKWWSNKEVVYEYPIKIIKMFDQPLKVNYDMSTPFVTDFSYEEDNDTINSLYKDLKILSSKYGYYKNINHQEIDGIIKETKKVCKKLQLNGVDTKSITLSNCSRELISKCFDSTTVCNSINDAWDNFAETTVIQNFVNIGMSNDKLEVRFRTPSPDNNTKNIIESKVSEIFPEWDKVSFVWGDVDIPSNTTPLFNLKLEKVGDKAVNENKEVHNTMQETDFLKVNNVDNVYHINYNEDSYAFEPKKEGRRLFVGKTIDSVLILNDLGEDVTDYYSTNTTIVFNELSSNNYLIECVERDNVFYVYDCLFFKKDIRNSPWFERKQAMNNFDFKENIEEVSSLIVTNEHDADKAHRLLCNLDNSIGVVVKPYNSKYEHGKWFSIDNLEGDTTSDTPGVEKIRGKTWKKKIIKPGDYYPTTKTKS